MPIVLFNVEIYGRKEAVNVITPRVGHRVRWSGPLYIPTDQTRVAVRDAGDDKARDGKPCVIVRTDLPNGTFIARSETSDVEYRSILANELWELLPQAEP